MVARAPGKLGWVRGPEDPRTLRLSTYTTPDLPPPPRTVDWLRKVPTWPMYANDRVGDCVPVSCAHLSRSWTTYAGGVAADITEADVLRAYTNIAGYDPVTGVPDNGCRATDALNYWRRTGIGGHRIGAYVRINHLDPVEVRTATWLFGGILLGADMPLAADTQFRAGATWAPTRGSAAYPGSWGGHAMHLGAFTSRALTVSTWGRTQRMTWPWFGRYVAEAYAVVSTDWLNQVSGHTPLGLDLPALLADLRRVTA